MLPFKPRIAAGLLGLFLIGCSSYRVTVQGVEIDRLIESRTAANTPEAERREAVFHNDLGVVREREGDLEGALDQYRLAREKDPGLVPAYINAGNVRVKQGDLPAAERLYRAALDRDPANPQALNNLAWAMVLEGRDLDGALSLLTLALAADPEHPYLYLDTMGWALYRRGDADGARETLRRALDRTPEDEPYLRAETHYHLAVIRREAGEDEEAAHHLRESLRYHPDPERERELEELTRGD